MFLSTPPICGCLFLKVMVGNSLFQANFPTVAPFACRDALMARVLPHALGERNRTCINIDECHHVFGHVTSCTDEM